MKIKQKQLDDTLSAAQGIIDFSCTATEQVGDLVYISSSDTVQQADASDTNKIDVIGYIISKPTSSTCKVATAGTITASGLTPGAKVFLSPTVAGSVTQTEPASPNVIVEVGFAKNSVSFIFEKGAVIL